MNAQLDALNKSDEKIKIEVTINEFNVILGALQELPHRVVDPILKNIFAQAQKQLGNAS